MASTSSPTSANPKDIFIPILGLSGSGKSRFIALCTGKDPDQDISSDNSKPLALQFTVHTFTHQSRTIHLIDTPSFDSPGHDHDAVLSAMTYYLLKSFSSGIRITGLIYTFPISAMRLTGSAWRALEIFKALVGVENAPSTALVTTMWDKVDRTVGEERVAELTQDLDFWGDFYAAGGHIEPVTMGDRRSALRVVSLLLGSGNPSGSGSGSGSGTGSGIETGQKEGRVLRIQREMVLDKKKLYETDAGRIAWAGITEERHRLESEVEDMREEMMGLIKVRQGRGRQSSSGTAAAGRELVKVQALDGRAGAMQKGGGELTAMWDLRVRTEMKQLRMELVRNRELLDELEECVREGMVKGRYQDKERRQELEKELQKVRKKVEGLQKVERSGLAAMDVLLTSGKVVGGGMGIAAAVVSLAACSVM